MRQLTIGPGPAATLLVVGDPDNPLPTLIQNIDPTNILYLGDNVGINSTQPNSCAPLNPGQTSVASGDINVFGIAAPGQVVSVNVYRGLMSFFQPLSQLIIAGIAAGIFLYAPTQGLGNLIGSWAAQPGIDAYGNVYPSGILLQADATNSATGILTVQDNTGTALLTIDGSGDISGVTGSFQDLNVGGLNLFSDIINPIPLGIINRGWTPSGGWPSTALGTSETALLELDYLAPAGRRFEFVVYPADIILTTAPTAPTQLVFRYRYTTDGSTPSTSSQEITGQSPMVITVPVANLLNYWSPYKTWIPSAPSVDTLYRILLTSNIQSGAYKYNTNLEARFIDLGVDNGNFINAGTVLGSGGSGGSSQQTYTKTYNSVEFASYYGDTASYGSGANSRRSYNSNMYQGCASGQINGSGDQYSFARFNYGQIATDLGAGVVNWVKLRLTNQHAWYNSGLNAVVGWSSYTGSFGTTFVPGAGTHMNQEHYHMNEGQTLTRTMGSWLKASITTGFTTIVLGTSNSYTNPTDLNNYGYFAGAGSTSTCPQLQINYTK
jgi:hypothetical protein